MKKLYFTSKEIGFKFGVKHKVIEKLFRKSKVPTLHRDSSNNKTLIERENFNIIFDLLTKMYECYIGNEYMSKKNKSMFLFNMFSHRLNTYHNEIQIVDLVSFMDNSLNVLVISDYKYDNFILIDCNDNNKNYKFDNLSITPQPTNNITYQSQHKSPHSVNGHFRNQPYGSRDNPQYRKIWISDFDKGVS